jgi:hypothetical protein
VAISALHRKILAVHPVTDFIAVSGNLDWDEVAAVRAPAEKLVLAILTRLAHGL